MKTLTLLLYSFISYIFLVTEIRQPFLMKLRVYSEKGDFLYMRFLYVYGLCLVK